MMLSRFSLKALPVLAGLVLMACPAMAQKGGSVLPGGDSKEPINITASKLDYFDKEQKLVYTGDVIAIQGESALKCTVLTIYMERDDKAAPAKAGDAPATGGSKVKLMDATGPVTLVQKDQVGTGNRAVYDKPKNLFTMMGNVTLTQGGNVTVGETLIYNLTTKQANVYSGSGNGRVQSTFTPGDDKKSDAKPKKPKPAAAQATN